MDQIIASIRDERDFAQSQYLKTFSPKWRSRAAWAARTLRSLEPLA